MQLDVKNSPFNEEQTELLNRLLPSLTETQRIWLSGYLTALFQPPTLSVSAPAVEAPAVQAALPAAGGPQEVTILYGSQTGNCQNLSQELAQKLKDRGFEVTVSAMNDFKANNLKKVKNLLILVSTHGEGDPPDNALNFYEFLHGKRAPRLEELRYSVLALGDTSYEFFCKTGKDFDQRLEELGAQRLVPRVDCDLDFEEPAAEWMEQVIAALGDARPAVSVTESLPAAGVAPPVQSSYSRTNPFEAEVLENINLNGRGSKRETRHLEISLEGSNLQYEPGDSLGIYPENHPLLVDRLLAEMGWNPEEPVPVNNKGEEWPLREALLRRYEITVLTKPLLQQVAERFGNAELQSLLTRDSELKEYMHERDLLDLLRDYFPGSLPARELVPLLRKIPARLYSIACSFKANPEEAHIAVRTIRYHAHGRDRYGVCSIQCAERIQPGDTLPVYIHQNPNFRLPADPEAPIIMIGPGTGVAPYRAFLEEREELGAGGKSWLFYGDQHFLTDFLYQVDWQRWLKDGVLTRMDVAFSRDTPEKVYVQHRMMEHSRELYAWLQEGAYLYVCGDEKRMAHDVHQTLLAILEKEGGMSHDQAQEYLAQMRQEKRYQRDVY